jgi:hypothetical protein
MGIRVRNRRVVALALTATTLLASGCGGSSGSSRPLTRAELVAKANAICTRVNARLTSSLVRNPQELTRIAPRMVSFEQTALTELTHLNPPASLADDWQQIVAGAETLVEDTAWYSEDARTNNLKGMHDLLASAEKIQRRIRATATRDGFNDCAGPI